MGLIKTTDTILFLETIKSQTFWTVQTNTVTSIIM